MQPPAVRCSSHLYPGACSEASRLTHFRASLGLAPAESAVDLMWAGGLEAGLPNQWAAEPGSRAISQPTSSRLQVPRVLSAKERNALTQAVSGNSRVSSSAPILQ